MSLSPAKGTTISSERWQPLPIISVISRNVKKPLFISENCLVTGAPARLWRQDQDHFHNSGGSPGLPLLPWPRTQCQPTQGCEPLPQSCHSSASPQLSTALPYWAHPWTHVQPWLVPFPRQMMDAPGLPWCPAAALLLLLLVQEKPWPHCLLMTAAFSSNLSLSTFCI